MENIAEFNVIRLSNGSYELVKSNLTNETESSRISFDKSDISKMIQRLIEVQNIIKE